MKCWHCDSDAKAICVFCGRAICAAHRKAKDYFIGYGTKHKSTLLEFSSTTATNIKEASWCGVCAGEDVDTY
jgi:hypothetical protein